MFWLANKVFIAHSLITLMGLGWSMLVKQSGLAVVFALLWLGALILWSEWRNA